MNDIIQILVAVYRDVWGVACGQRKKLACGVPWPIQNDDEFLLHHSPIFQELGVLGENEVMLAVVDGPVTPMLRQAVEFV
jgi:hypothetical protein